MLMPDAGPVTMTSKDEPPDHPALDAGVRLSARCVLQTLNVLLANTRDVYFFQRHHFFQTISNLQPDKYAREPWTLQVTHISEQAVE